ncbi:hypothetical protein [Brachybacterium sacelli]|uniref:hypothetical protein n=1 Tax=Brachybacterium sacelli TaxID=173364 RepID=UPI003610251E
MDNPHWGGTTKLRRRKEQSRSRLHEYVGPRISRADTANLDLQEPALRRSDFRSRLLER